MIYFLQVSAIIARITSFALSVTIISKISEGVDFLVFIGYLPFLALIDELVKAYSRSVYLNGLRSLDILSRYRRIFAYSTLSLIILGLTISLFHSNIFFIQVLIGLTYIAGGLSLIWEKWTSHKLRSLHLAIVELSLLLVAIASYFIIRSEWILILCFISFPLARLITLMGLKNDSSVYQGNLTHAEHGVKVYTLFAVSQQIVGAISASMPSIYSQITGDNTNMAHNLIFFRLIHSMASAGSMFINAIASRIFYGTASVSFYNFEVIYLKLAMRSASLLGFIGIASFLIISTASINYLAPIIMLAATLFLFNFESSLVMNCGLPKLALKCQLLVFCVSLIAMLLINQKNELALYMLFFFSLSVSPLWKSILRYHYEYLQKKITI
jgi:hypothetical protein